MIDKIQKMINRFDEVLGGLPTPCHDQNDQSQPASQAAEPSDPELLKLESALSDAQEKFKRASQLGAQRKKEFDEVATLIAAACGKSKKKRDRLYVIWDQAFHLPHHLSTEHDVRRCAANLRSFCETLDKEGWGRPQIVSCTSPEFVPSDRDLGTEYFSNARIDFSKYKMCH